MEPTISPYTNIRAADAECMMMDGEIGGAIYGTIYPTDLAPRKVLKLVTVPEGLLANLE